MWHTLRKSNSIKICRVITLIFFNRAASKEEIRKSGVTVAALFFGKVFGAKAERALSAIVGLR
jgi:L-type amino acid transporter 9